jgi:hypothetical protein
MNTNSHFSAPLHAHTAPPPTHTSLTWRDADLHAGLSPREDEGPILRPAKALQVRRLEGPHTCGGSIDGWECVCVCGVGRGRSADPVEGWESSRLRLPVFCFAMRVVGSGQHP